MLTTYSQKLYAKAEILKGNVIERVRNFNSEETSAKGTSEEGVLVYIGVALGILVGAIVILFGKDVFTVVMNQFKTGTSKVPTGWQ